jgi:ArsR family transcriptional regulator
LTSDSIFDLQATLCQTMSNATRLRIVHSLRDGPMCVAAIARTLELGPSQVSQHLGTLKSNGIVTRQRRGAEMVYQITNPKIEQICDLMREVLAEQAVEAAQRAEMIQALQSKK